jgi:hypothetical protein
MDRHRQAGRLTDIARQTDRETDSQADREMDRHRQAGRLTDIARQTDRQTDTDEQTQTSRQTDGQIQTDRQTDRRTDGRTDGQTDQSLGATEFACLLSRPVIPHIVLHSAVAVLDNSCGCLKLTSV